MEIETLKTICVDSIIATTFFIIFWIFWTILKALLSKR